MTDDSKGSVQWASSDGDVVWTTEQPGENWAPLPNQRPSAWGDDDTNNTLILSVPDRLGLLVFIEFVWHEGRWRRTTLAPFTGVEVDAYLKSKPGEVHDVGVTDDGFIASEKKLK